MTPPDTWIAKGADVTQSTVSVKPRKASKKPAKPREDFPLFPHASGRWAKKVRRNFAYFGKVADDPTGEAALNLWLEQKDELLAGPHCATTS